jgi:hypothetical protein
VYGPVRTVAWQGGVREDSPYADFYLFTIKKLLKPSYRNWVSGYSHLHLSLIQRVG